MCIENKKYRLHCYGRQHGFVLVMALVLMGVLTLIGVSSMNSASMDLRAASNAKNHQIAFNAVQSVIEYAVSSDGATNIDYQISDKTITQTVNYNGLADVSELVASVDYAGCSRGEGSSLEEGKGFSFNHFNILATGGNKAGTATSTQAQGIRFPAAACDKKL
jgi:hypothetical protein